MCINELKGKVHEKRKEMEGAAGYYTTEEGGGGKAGQGIHQQVRGIL